MKGDVGGIFSNAADWKTLFLLKIKIKQNPAAQIKNENVVFSNTFIRIWGLIWTNDWENTAYWEESEQREVLANKFGLSQIQFAILVLVTTVGKFWNFSPFLHLEIAFPALKLTENCYLNMKISFSWKMAI